MKQFIFQQLDIIAGAIRDYPLAGVKAFKQAAKDAVFHEAEHSEVVVQYDGAPQMTSLKAIQAKVVKLSKFSIQLSQFLSAMDTIYHHGGTVDRSWSRAPFEWMGATPAEEIVFIRPTFAIITDTLYP